MISTVLTGTTRPGPSSLNSIPKANEGTIVLGDGSRNGGTFAFGIDESEEVLERRLSTPLPKKKGRC